MVLPCMPQTHSCSQLSITVFQPVLGSSLVSFFFFLPRAPSWFNEAWWNQATPETTPVQFSFPNLGSQSAKIWWGCGWYKKWTLYPLDSSKIVFTRTEAERQAERSAALSFKLRYKVSTTRYNYDRAGWIFPGHRTVDCYRVLYKTEVLRSAM